MSSPTDTDTAAPPPTSGGAVAPGRSRRWDVAALVIFAVAAAATYADVWRAGPATSVPLGWSREAVVPPYVLERNLRDVIFEVALVSRHAHTLVRRPDRIFDTEHCAPTEKSLAYGIPMLTMGILGIPFQLAFGEPVATYNAVLVAITALGALAMYLLVADWTAVPAAGIAAGLWFAFHSHRLQGIVHPSVWNTTWTVFALFFARRWLAGGRWRDALGLGAAVALQMWESFYPFLAAVLLAPPLAVWLLRRCGVARIRPGQVAAVVAIALVAGAIVFGPYLAVREATGLLERSGFYYAQWSAYLPGRAFFPSWTLLALAGAALLLGWRCVAAGVGGDPRWALLGSATLVAVVAAGPHVGDLLRFGGDDPVVPVPDFYAALATLLPGLSSVRVVSRLTTGVHLVLCLLAGLGAAGVIRAVGSRPRAAALASGFLIALAAGDMLRPGSFGLERPYRWTLHAVRPSDAAIAFYAALARQGNAGPILEFPADSTGPWIGRAPDHILLAAYHHRRTSACFGSYRPDRRALEAAARRLPERAALAELRRMGFTTLVFHEAAGPGAVKQRFDAQTRGPHAPLARLLAAADRTAYAIVPAREEVRP